MKLRVPYFNLICFLGLVAVMTMPLQAQAKKGATKKPAAAKSSTKKSVKLSPAELAAMEERKAMAQPSGNYKVDVYIKKSGVVSGLAMKGEFVEKRGHKGYQAAKKGEVGSGIRLWYYSDLPGFLFIQYASIEKIVVGRQMTLGEMKSKAKLEERPENQVGGGAKRMAMADMPNYEELGKVVVLKKNGAMKRGFAGMSEAQVTLMKAYSPEEGYSPKRYAALQKAVVLKNKKLSPIEDQWTAVYPDWLVAYKLYTGQTVVDPKAKSSSKSPAAKKPAKVCKTTSKAKKRPAKPAAKINKDKQGRVDIKRKVAKPAPATPSGEGMNRGR